MAEGQIIAKMKEIIEPYFILKYFEAILPS